jgi:hypothetical protein
MFFLSGENISRLHGSSLFATQEAFNHESLFHAEDIAVIANPISLGQLVNAVTTLVDRNITISTKNN